MFNINQINCSYFKTDITIRFMCLYDLECQFKTIYTNILSPLNSTFKRCKFDSTNF